MVFYSRAEASLRIPWVGIVVVQTIVSLVIVALLVKHFGISCGNVTFFGKCKNCFLICL